MVDTDNSRQTMAAESANTQPNESGEMINSSVTEKKETENAREQAKEGQEAVKQNIVGSAIAGAEIKSDRVTLQAETQATIDLKTYRGYIEALTQLIFEIDGCTQTAKYKSGLNQSGKQTLKTAREKLKQYKDIMKDKKRMIEHEFSAKNRLNSQNLERAPLKVNISETEIQELKNRRFRRKQQIEYDIKQGQNGKSSNTAPWPNQSLEQVMSGNRVDQAHNNYDTKLNEALQDAAFLRTIDNNQDTARQILQGIANNSLSDQQIVVIQTNMPQLSPYFEQYGMTSQVHRCIQTRGGRYNQNYQNYGNMDLSTAYKTGGVTGWLNSLLIKGFPNAKPEHVSNFTNVAVAAGGIYAIYRIGKRFFGKNKDGKRNLLGKTALLASGYFVPQLLLGQDGYSLLGDILTGRADFSELRYRAGNSLRFIHNNSPEVYAQMAPGILGMSIFPQTYTVDNVRALQQTFSDQNAWQQRYSTTYTRLNKDNSALANEFKNTFNANQYNENEWKVFLAKLGITYKTNGDTIVFNEAARVADKKTSFELWMKSQGKTRNPAFKEQINDYLKQQGEFNPDDLNPNRFKDKNDAKYTMREEDFKNKEALNDQVDNLQLEPQKKSDLKAALEGFYDERTIESKPDINNFSLDTEGSNILIIKSHGGNQTKIDLNSNTLKGFGSTNGNSYEIRFSNLSEALDVADLTNSILHITEKQFPAANPPFRYERSKKAICFNDAKLRSLDLDTRILNINWFKNRGTVDQHADEYARYLSNRRFETYKVEIDSTKYPTVKTLSEKTKITFTNENEVMELETRLNKIKNDLSEYYATPKGSPFSLRLSWKIDKNLVFTAVDGEKMVFNENISNRFPTILANKSQFLAFMNDANNGMYNQ